MTRTTDALIAAAKLAAHHQYSTAHPDSPYAEPLSSEVLAAIRVLSDLNATPAETGRAAAIIDAQPPPSPLRRGPYATDAARTLWPYVCDQSYDHLVQCAKRDGYIRTDARTDKGLSRYIIDTVMVPGQRFHDTRPEWMRASDRLRSEQYKPPMFIDRDHCYDAEGAGRGRKQRRINSRGLDATTLAHIVTDLNIGDGPSNIGAALKSAHAQLGALLEAWGQGTVTPALAPNNPPEHATRRRAMVDMTGGTY